MQRALVLLALLACMVCDSGCGLLKKQLLWRKRSPVPADKNLDVLIGIVESVNPEQKFVVVRTNLRLTLGAGTRLEARSASGAKSTLVVTPERKMNFLSADIAEGLPSVGDVVVLPAHAAVPPAAPQSPPAAPGALP